ncbi:terpenoid cyclases/Protein prenyltransferase [Dacryopinax primogenitus]|uniref:Protein farnesyltransferase subunit beta n=1 Tax=Dacryopinax primogenitus (strain DJM 731) TaxID=1858805 RepID=M5FU94_DACPD|nr:terpenoid cyclases/Protein prenyltransferase [Dacryopinax primogenitus]EJU01281.1 terpenoid cyclases/Protein prenyltransferase [Dacryopinax primogenitus]
MSLPSLFSSPRPTPTDALSTPTSQDQSSTESLIIPLLSKPDTLHRREHMMWLLRLLFRGFPDSYSSQDASQPWLIYWVLQSLIQLGGVMDPESAKKGVQTIMRFWSPSGGFAGGPYQNAHVLPTYAAVCALAIVGGRPGEGGGWDQIDRYCRAKLYDFFLSLKQSDGSFIVCENGEVDMRGCYCLLCVATMLDILTLELVEGLAEYIANCQTYEGGFSSACYYLSSARGRLGEAHGGYTYCALASLFLLRPLVPHVFHLIDLPRLVRWATGMQGLPVEGAGFRGRTNKLVDGCYSWWVGGMEPLLRELVREKAGGEGEWEDWDDAVFQKEGIQHYTLAIAQLAQGGLRDKPSKPPDAYHTACNLAGLATAQHRVARSPQVRQQMLGKWAVARNPQVEDREGRREAYLASCEWAEDEGADVYLGGEDNRVNAVHPLYNLTITSVRKMMGHFYAQEPVKSSVDQDD